MFNMSFIIEGIYYNISLEVILREKSKKSQSLHQYHLQYLKQSLAKLTHWKCPFLEGRNLPTILKERKFVIEIWTHTSSVWIQCQMLLLVLDLQLLNYRLWLDLLCWYLNQNSFYIELGYIVFRINVSHFREIFASSW